MKKCPPHLKIKLTLSCENETSHFILLYCTLRTTPAASSMVWTIGYSSSSTEKTNWYHISMFNVFTFGSNTSSQACWPLVNCINQWLLQAAPDSCAMCVAASRKTIKQTRFFATFLTNFLFLFVSSSYQEIPESVAEHRSILISISF